MTKVIAGAAAAMLLGGMGTPLVMPSFAQEGTARPAVDSISGVAADGKILTVGGSRFGSHPRDIEWLGGSGGNIEKGRPGYLSVVNADGEASAGRRVSSGFIQERK